MTDKPTGGLSIFFERLFKFLASLRLAIIVMSSLAIMSAIGTVVEARYDAQYAQKLVYHSPIMYVIFALLCVNLINVMVDRLPWKRHHMGFIFAHVGIILLIVGSLVTKIYGIDGSLSFEIGQSNRIVVVPDTEFRVLGTVAPGPMRELYRKTVDFLVKPPDEDKVEVPLGTHAIKVKDYYHYAVPETKVIPTMTKSDPVAIRLQMQNPNVNMTQWLFKPQETGMSVFNLGPARIMVVGRDYKHIYGGGNELLLRPISDDTIAYEIYTGSKGGLNRKGRVGLGDTIDTGWMGLVARILNYHPNATEKTSFQPRERPTGNTTSAVLVEFSSDSESKEHWIGLNSHMKFQNGDQTFIAAFSNRQVDIGFDMKLEKFSVGRYEGTNRPKSYESEVSVPGFGQVKISMNEPFKHNGLTFYQASFQEDENGQPVASILSVNRDPGRWIKYLGSILIVLGTVVMFWFKHYRAKIFSKVISESGAA